MYIYTDTYYACIVFIQYEEIWHSFNGEKTDRQREGERQRDEEKMTPFFAN